MKLLLSVLILLTSMAITRPALSGTIASHCQADELTLFSCPLKKKVVSYCAAPKQSPYKYIEYRYGAIGKVEKTYKSEATNKNKLFAYTSRFNPRASLDVVWFEEGRFTYSMLHCNGMTCNGLLDTGEDQATGLVVMKNESVISKQFCKLEADEASDNLSMDRFPFIFGVDEGKGASQSPLILPKEHPTSNNGIESIEEKFSTQILK